LELVEVVVAGGVSGLAGGDVGLGGFGVGEVGGEAFARAEVEAGCVDGGGVAGVGLQAGAGGDAEEAAEEAVAAQDGVGDFYGVDGAVGPAGEIGGGVVVAQGLGYGGGEEVVPVGVSGRKPAGGGVLEQEFEGGVALVPGVERREGFGLAFGRRAVVGFDLRSEQHRPELGAGGGDDGGGGGIERHVAVEVAEEVGGLMEAFGVLGEGACGGVVESVSETVGEDEVEVGVGVILDGQHILGLEERAGGEELADTLDAVGIDPVVGEVVGVVVGRYAGVGGGEDAGGWVDDLREVGVGDVAGPGLCGVEGVYRDGGDWVADGVVEGG